MKNCPLKDTHILIPEIYKCYMIWESFQVRSSQGF